jgi:hypothetical protein
MQKLFKTLKSFPWRALNLKLSKLKKKSISKKFFKIIKISIYPIEHPKSPLKLFSKLRKYPIMLFTCAPFNSLLFLLFDHSIEEHLPHRYLENYFFSPSPFSVLYRLISLSHSFRRNRIFIFIQFFRHKNISLIFSVYVSMAFLNVLHCLNLVILSQWYLILLMLLYSLSLFFFMSVSFLFHSTTVCYVSFCLLLPLFILPCVFMCLHASAAEESYRTFHKYVFMHALCYHFNLSYFSALSLTYKTHIEVWWLMWSYKSYIVANICFYVDHKTSYWWRITGGDSDWNIRGEIEV